jgi:anti-anti-sigma factor
MKYRNSVSEGEVLLTLEETLTFVDAEIFAAALADVEAGGQRRWVVDLRGLDFIDSFGLGLLVVMFDRAEKDRVKLVLRGAKGLVRDRLDYTRFDMILTLED